MIAKILSHLSGTNRFCTLLLKFCMQKILLLPTTKASRNFRKCNKFDLKKHQKQELLFHRRNSFLQNKCLRFAQNMIPKLSVCRNIQKFRNKKDLKSHSHRLANKIFQTCNNF